MNDRTARRILLEAADDYASMALREAAIAELGIPAYQAVVGSNASPTMSR
jgi:hypothetical protein